MAKVAVHGSGRGVGLVTTLRLKKLVAPAVLCRAPLVLLLP